MSRARDLANLGGSADAGGLTGRNIIINGNMAVAQRGTSQSISNGSGYVCDRYECAIQTSTGQITFSQDSDAPAGFVNSTKMVVDTDNGSLSAAEHCLFQQKLEGLNVAHLGWGTSDAQDVTVSFWIKGSVTGTYTYYFLDESADSQSYVAPFTIDSANTWERKTITITAPTTGGTTDFPITNARHSYTGISLGQGSDHITTTTNAWHSTTNFAATTSGAVSLIGNSAATLYVTGWQIEVGQRATPFEHESFGATLAKCQRYFSKSYDYSDAPGTVTQTGAMYERNETGTTVSNRAVQISFPVEMRTNPTATVYSLNGTSGSVSDCTTSYSHNADDTLCSFNGTDGTRGISKLTGVSVDDMIGFHFTAEAEL